MANDIWKQGIYEDQFNQDKDTTVFRNADDVAVVRVSQDGSSSSTFVNIGDATEVVTVTGESTTLVTGAGSTGKVRVQYAPIMDSVGGKIGSSTDNSFSVGGTLLTGSEIAYDETNTDTETYATLSNGDYAVDYIHGVVYYKNSGAGTAETADYIYTQTIGSSTASSSSAGGAGIMVGVDTGSYAFDASNKTVTFSSLGTVALEQVLKITNVTDNIVIYDPTNPDLGGSISTNVLTLTYDTTSMADSDDLQIYLQYDSGTVDYALSVLKTTEQSPLWNRYTDVETIVSGADIGTVDDTWVDAGSEIDCRGYKTIGIWVELTVNDSTGNQLQVLSKHTNAGATEYVLETSSDYQKTIGDSDINILYSFNVVNVPYVQIQTKATDVATGGGTEGTVNIYLTKEY